MPAKGRPRPQRLTIAGCAHAFLCMKDPTAHTSPTRQPRTRKCWQQQKRPNDEQADHTTANTTMHQPSRCGNNDATINRPDAGQPTPNQPGMQGSKRGTAAHGWATQWCTTPADDHTHGHDKTPQLYHYTTNEATATNYFKLPAPRESASSTELGGVSVRPGMRVP